MNQLDKLKLRLQKKEPSPLRDYFEHVANGPLLVYKQIVQYGGKRGETLYTHVLNGVLLLDALSEPIGLTDTETRLLFAVFTVHDLNKKSEFAAKSYHKLAIPDNFEQEIERLNLTAFFPTYLSI